jgi:hypothetical protein
MTRWDKNPRCGNGHDIPYSVAYKTLGYKQLPSRDAVHRKGQKPKEVIYGHDHLGNPSTSADQASEDSGEETPFHLED